MKSQDESTRNLLKAANAFINGRVVTGKRMLRRHIVETLGFPRLADEAEIPLVRLKRMFAPKGDLRMKELFRSLTVLQREAGIELHVAAE